MLHLCYSRFKAWGGKDPHRTAEDVAFAVARFYQNGGILQNYYMVSYNNHHNFFPCFSMDCVHVFLWIVFLIHFYWKFSIMEEQISDALQEVHILLLHMIMMHLLMNMVIKYLILLLLPKLCNQHKGKLNILKMENFRKSQPAEVWTFKATPCSSQTWGEFSHQR